MQRQTRIPAPIDRILAAAAAQGAFCILGQDAVMHGTGEVRGTLHDFQRAVFKEHALKSLWLHGWVTTGEEADYQMPEQDFVLFFLPEKQKKECLILAMDWAQGFPLQPAFALCWFPEGGSVFLGADGTRSEVTGLFHTDADGRIHCHVAEIGRRIVFTEAAYPGGWASAAGFHARGQTWIGAYSTQAHEEA